MKPISFKAILIGIVVLILLDGLGELALAYIINGRLDKSEILLFYSEAPFIYWRTIEALIALIVAGYLTARLAKKEHYLNSAVVGGVALLLTAIGYNAEWHPLFAVMAFSTQVPFVLLGCYLFKRRLLIQ